MLAEKPSEWARGWDWMVERRKERNRKEDYHLHRRRSSWGDENISPLIAPSVATLLKPWTHLEITAAQPPHNIPTPTFCPWRKELFINIRARSSPGLQDDWFQWPESVLMQRELGTEHTVRGYRAVHWPPERLIQWIRRQSPHDDGNYTCISLWSAECSMLWPAECSMLFNSINLIIKKSAQ